MQPPPCRAYSGPELLYDLRDCPYHIGQRLWVRESFNWADRDDLLPGETSKFCPERAAYSAKNVVWKADGATEHPAYGKAFWKPSIHMPRWASRLTLELTEVRVERVQDISEADAKAEGCQEAYDEPFELGSAAQRENEKNGYFPPSSYASGYAALWDQINAKRAAAIYAWAKNPWVWALEFKRVQL